MENSFEVQINGVVLDYDILQFSGGELHVKLKGFDKFEVDDSSIIFIKTEKTPSYMIMELALLVDAIRNVFDARYKLILGLLYMPYGRQDRVCNEGEAFSLRVFADMLNAIEFDDVLTLDPHSDVTAAVLNRSTVVDMATSLEDSVLLHEGYSHIVSPDAGAYKKTQKVAELFGVPVIPCLKTRDTKNGKLSDPIVVTNGIADVKRMLIVDDICDGGYTFIQLAKELKKLYPQVEIDLYVSHGIFSKGTEVLSSYFNKIYCANLMSNSAVGVLEI